MLVSVLSTSEHAPVLDGVVVVGDGSVAVLVVLAPVAANGRASYVALALV